MIQDLVRDLDSANPRIRYRAVKALRVHSEKKPGEIYPYLDRFLALAEGDITFLRWGSQRILGNLAGSDSSRRLDAVLDRLLAPITGHEMIGAANAIGAAAQIARAKPQLADRIARAVMKVSRARYATPECRNIAIGHALRGLDTFFPFVRDRGPVLAFARKQLANSRQATRRHAERFLKHWAPKGSSRARVL